MRTRAIVWLSTRSNEELSPCLAILQHRLHSLYFACACVCACTRLCKCPRTHDTSVCCVPVLPAAVVGCLQVSYGDMVGCDNDDVSAYFDMRMRHFPTCTLDNHTYTHTQHGTAMCPTACASACASIPRVMRWQRRGRGWQKVAFSLLVVPVH